MGSLEFAVHIARDEESGIWFIAQSDIPGLRLEARTATDLIRKVEDVAHDLIELNADEIAARRPRRPASEGGRQAVSIRPVFDSPLAVA